jgi:hypothetical protein
MSDTDQPKQMFLNRVLWGRVVYSHHTADAAYKTDAKHEPWKMLVSTVSHLLCQTVHKDLPT